MTNEKLSLRSMFLGLVTLLALGVGISSTATYAQDEPVAEATAVATDNAVVPEADAVEESAPSDDSSVADAAQPQEEVASESDQTQAPVASETTVAEVKDGAMTQRIIIFGLFVLLCVVSFFFSRVCSAKFRMPENAFGYFIICFCLLGATISSVKGLLEHRVNLGVDLRGGSILVYSVSPNKESGHDVVTNEDMNGLKEAIMKRVNPSGVREIAIQELGANTEIKITIPEADDVEVARLERVINDTGQLKFRILASTASTDAGEKRIIEEARRPEYEHEQSLKLDDVTLGDGVVVGATWLPVDPTQTNVIRQDCVARPSQYKPREDEIGTDSVPLYDVLVLELAEGYDVNGNHIEYVQQSFGSMGEPEVVFSMRP